MSQLLTVLGDLRLQIAQLEAKVAAMSPSDQLRPQHDTYGTGQVRRHGLDRTDCRVIAGRVVDALPFYGWYRVSLDGVNSVVSCNLLSDVGFGPTGVRRVGALQPGVRVYVVWHQAATHGSIIGAEPGFTSDPRRHIHESVSQVSTDSPANDPTVPPLVGAPGGGVTDYSAASPLDETSGSYGHLTENGTGHYIDEFMCFLRADENTGFWAFWHDQLARVSGHNLQIRSAVEEYEFLDDEDELMAAVGSTPYLHEALGLFAPGADGAAARQTDAAGSQIDSPHLAPVDVRFDDQVPFHRHVRHGGYLGQGQLVQQKLPPADPPAVHRMSEPPACPGVFEEHLSLDGDYFLATARGFTIAHVPVFPVHERRRRPEDPDGDSRAGGYAPGGIAADGSVAHKVQGDPAGPQPAGAGSALLADDDIAYGRAWKARHPFHYHGRDWTEPDPALLPGSAEAPVDPRLLSDRQYLPRPDPASYRVDRRYSAQFYPTASFVRARPDGTLVLGGPCGEEIRLGGGSVEISCPGDIVLRPGRSLVGMAGRDVCVLARQNLDLSATVGDVRVKAERHLEVLAANGGEGVLLLESRSAVDEYDFTRAGSDATGGGVVIRSAGVIGVLGNTVYLRSDGGGVTLDANQGADDIVLHASTCYRFLQAAATDAFGAGGSVNAVNQFTAAGGRLTGTLEVGAGVFDGPVVVAGGLSVVGGHVQTTDADRFAGAVGALTEEALDQAQDQVDAVGSNRTADVEAAEDRFGALEAAVYAAGRIAGEEALGTVGFSFRTPAQYRTEDLLIYESRWAQRARLAGRVGSVWRENPVQLGSETTYPYPGRAGWLGSTYRTVDLMLYDVSAGLPAGPATMENAAYAAEQAAVLDGGYPVID